MTAKRKNDSPLSTKPLAAMGRALEYAKLFSMRVLVHFCAILCTGAILHVAPAPEEYTHTYGLGLYIGLVCLVARGMRLEIQWLGPAGLGLLQAGILIFAGFPLPQAIFWGGAQVWVQRLFVNRFAMGTEWVVLLFLLPLGIQFGGIAPKLKLMLGSFLGLTFAGRVLLRKVMQRLAALRNPSMKEALSTANRTAPFQASIATLREKQRQLPAKIRPAIAAIAVSAENILACMDEDPRDLDPGERFLKRYLPAAHTLVDKHQRLAREETLTMDLVEALGKSEEMLQRLETAFAREHDALLKNNVDDFSADLKVLDTLLKMDGR